MCCLTLMSNLALTQSIEIWISPQTWSQSCLGPMCLVRLRWWVSLAHILGSHKTRLSWPPLPCFLRKPLTLSFDFLVIKSACWFVTGASSILRSSTWFTEVWCSQTSTPSKGDLWPFIRNTCLTKARMDVYPRGKCSQQPSISLGQKAMKHSQTTEQAKGWPWSFLPTICVTLHMF